MATQRLKDAKTELVSRIINDHFNGELKRLLVVGCGAGVEAAILARCLETEVIGIDVVENFDPDSAQLVLLQYGDAMAMSFENDSFDFVYSYHALEHIPDPEKALNEIKRVLKPGGSYWIGTPNRSRLIGYLGSKDASLIEKIKWNLVDWKARLKGEFKNELGAHAGFSATELDSMLADVFSEVHNVSNTYFHMLYKNYRYVLRALELSGLSVLVYPSIYFIGRK